MEADGYVLRIREPHWFEHRLFRGPDAEINLHIFSAGSPETDRMGCPRVDSERGSRYRPEHMSRHFYFRCPA